MASAVSAVGCYHPDDVYLLVNVHSVYILSICLWTTDHALSLWPGSRGARFKENIINAWTIWFISLSLHQPLLDYSNSSNDNPPTQLHSHTHPLSKCLHPSSTPVASTSVCEEKKREGKGLLIYMLRSMAKLVWGINKTIKRRKR